RRPAARRPRAPGCPRSRCPPQRSAAGRSGSRCSSAGFGGGARGPVPAGPRGPVRAVPAERYRCRRAARSGAGAVSGRRSVVHRRWKRSRRPARPVECCAANRPPDERRNPGMAGIAVLLYLVLILMSGGLARRVLGVPIGWPRVIVVGFVVLASAYGVVYGVLTSSGLRLDPDSAQEDPLPYVVLPILAMAWTFLGGLVLLVLLEIFLPTGTLPPVRALFTGWRARLRRARRYAQISAIAARHGLGAYLRGRRRTAPVHGMAKTARSLTAALTEPGVAFIKFGQMLSSRPDLVPDVFVRELSRLQTGAGPGPWPRIEAAIEEALGRPIGEVFASVDP